MMPTFGFAMIRCDTRAMSRDRFPLGHLAEKDFAGTKKKPERLEPCIAVDSVDSTTVSSRNMSLQECTSSLSDHDYKDIKQKLQTVRRTKFDGSWEAALALRNLGGLDLIWQASNRQPTIIFDLHTSDIDCDTIPHPLTNDNHLELPQCLPRKEPPVQPRRMSPLVPRSERANLCSASHESSHPSTIPSSMLPISRKCTYMRP